MSQNRKKIGIHIGQVVLSVLLSSEGADFMCTPSVRCKDEQMVHDNLGKKRKEDRSLAFDPIF